MGVPSPAVLALLGCGYARFHAGANFALTEFSEVRISPAQHPWAPLAEIGGLEGYYLTFPGFLIIALWGPLPLGSSILPSLFVSVHSPVRGGIKVGRESGVFVSGCRF